jgi:FdhD protein
LPDDVSDPKPSPDPIAAVAARRLSTSERPAPPMAQTVQIVREAALVIDVERAESYTLLCTPTDLEALAAGFLLTEGVIDGLAEVVTLRPCADDPLTIRVRLAERVPRIADPGRNLLIVSSCGLCGAEELASKVAALPRVGDNLQVEATFLRRSVQALRRQQPLFAACGGTHAAGLFDSSGVLLAVAEDTGRHNALDKAIGRCLLAGRSPVGCAAVLSGRVSLEMVGKCARAGIELVSAVSAPTSLAVEVAERCGITLCAFVRGTRATVFTHPERLRSAPDIGTPAATLPRAD